MIRFTRTEMFLLAKRAMGPSVPFAQGTRPDALHGPQSEQSLPRSQRTEILCSSPFLLLPSSHTPFFAVLQVSSQTDFEKLTGGRWRSNCSGAFFPVGILPEAIGRTSVTAAGDRCRMANIACSFPGHHDNSINHTSLPSDHVTLAI